MPAIPATPDRAGKEANGRIVAGLGLELFRIALPLLGNSEEGQILAEAIAKVGKKFVKPPQDLGESQLKFMASQIYGGGGPSQGGPAQPPQPMPPAPPLPPGLQAQAA